MAIYSGNISHKKNLGRTRPVVATDDPALAHAFGVDGASGQHYSNGKIGMLQLDGANGRTEIAVDPGEMDSIFPLDYVRQNAHRVVDFGLLANALEPDYRNELQQGLNRAVTIGNYRFSELSNDARGAVVKYILDIGDADEINEHLQDDYQETVREAVSRQAARVYASETEQIGGLEVYVGVRGTTAVKITDKSIFIRLTMSANVAGSASNAGKDYRDSFKEIKTAVTEAEAKFNGSDESDVVVRFNNNQSIDEITSEAIQKYRTRSEQIVQRTIDMLRQQFADVENYNPAGAKSRLWNELHLTSDVSQGGLSDVDLKAYASGAISALEVAQNPENGIVAKLNAAVIKRLDSADVDSLRETAMDRAEVPAPQRDDLLMPTITRIEKNLEDVKTSIDDVTDFKEAHANYTGSNQQWVTGIIQPVVTWLTAQIDDERGMSPDNLSMIKPVVQNLLRANVRDTSLRLYPESDYPGITDEERGVVVDDVAMTLSEEVIVQLRDHGSNIEPFNQVQDALNDVSEEIPNALAQAFDKLAPGANQMADEQVKNLYKAQLAGWLHTRLLEHYGSLYPQVLPDMNTLTERIVNGPAGDKLIENWHDHGADYASAEAFTMNQVENGDADLFDLLAVIPISEADMHEKLINRAADEQQALTNGMEKVSRTDFIQALREEEISDRELLGMPADALVEMLFPNWREESSEDTDPTVTKSDVEEALIAPTRHALEEWNGQRETPVDDNAIDEAIDAVIDNELDDFYQQWQDDASDETTLRDFVADNYLSDHEIVELAVHKLGVLFDEASVDRNEVWQASYNRISKDINAIGLSDYGRNYQKFIDVDTIAEKQTEAHFDAVFKAVKRQLADMPGLSVEDALGYVYGTDVYSMVLSSGFMPSEPEIREAALDVRYEQAKAGDIDPDWLRDELQNVPTKDLVSAEQFELLDQYAPEWEQHRTTSELDKVLAQIKDAVPDRINKVVPELLEERYDGQAPSFVMTQGVQAVSDEIAANWITPGIAQDAISQLQNGYEYIAEYMDKEGLSYDVDDAIQHQDLEDKWRETAIDDLLDMKNADPSYASVDDTWFRQSLTQVELTDVFRGLNDLDTLMNNAVLADYADHQKEED